MGPGKNFSLVDYVERLGPEYALERTLSLIVTLKRETLRGYSYLSWE
jgi:hypothetical protein